MGLAGLNYGIPELYAVAAGISQVKLVPKLARIAGTRDHQAHAIKLALFHEVIRDVKNAAPNRSVITSFDLGPWICSGPTSGSVICTSRPSR